MKQRRLLFLPFVGIVLFIAIAFFILDVILKGWFLDRNEAELVNIIDAAADSIVRISAEPEDMQVIAENISSVTKHYKVTITNENGDVLGISSIEFIQENITKIDIDRHLEFSDARIKEIGKSIRFDVNEGINLLHLVKKFQHNSDIYFIRVSMNTEDYTLAVQSLRLFLIAMAVGLFLLLATFIFVYLKVLNQSIKSGHDLLEKRVKERTLEILLLQRLSSMLAACKFINEVEDVVKDIVPRIIGDVPCAVTLVNSSRNLVEMKMHWGGEWFGEAVYNPDECWSLRKGNYHFSKDDFSSQTCPHMNDYYANTLCIPLLAHGQTIGVFHILVGDNFTEEIKSIAFTIAEHISLALANITLQETLRNQASCDPLTGLFNRRYMEQSLELELSRSLRHKTSCALLMLDIDHFKLFNDNYGHDAGDFVLKFLAKLLINTVRKEDIICRIGGEEIAIILPQTNLEEATNCAKKICTTVNDQHLVYHNLTLGDLTVSIGGSLFPMNASNYQELVKVADVELYKVKHNGRNGFSIKEPLREVTKINNF